MKLMRILTRAVLLISLVFSASSAQLWAESSDPFASSSFGDELSQDEFLPVEDAYKLTVLFSADGALLAQWQIADNYYLYRDRFKFADASGKNLTASMSEGKIKEDEYFGTVEVFYHAVEVALTDLPQESFTLAVTSQGCADAGLCYPPHTQNFIVDPINQSVVADGAISTAPPGASSNQKTAKEPVGLAYMLLLAALGGMILNLMPCVFPVLSLKVLGFVNDQDHNQKIHGLSYTAGVIISFIAVAAILFSLRAAGNAIGWGFHLQSPEFVTLLAYLFLGMGLSFSGAIELGAGITNTGSGLASKSGYAGSFFTGVLATVVASPCTAPFMGTALGWAVTQPSVIGLSIFAALGFGMAVPILILCLSPQALRYLPKPGPWMDTFKQLLAFPLYITVVWLLWVAGRQAGVDAMGLILLGCVSIALACWIWGHGSIRKVLSIAAVVFAIAIVYNPIVSEGTAQTDTIADKDWETFSEEKLAELRQQGKPVFVNITADWCITCLANEKSALATTAVKDAFETNNIVYLKGDWTNRDPKITALLAKYDRNGIPLYLAFPSDPSQSAKILPQILTPKIVVSALESL